MRHINEHQNSEPLTVTTYTEYVCFTLPQCIAAVTVNRPLPGFHAAPPRGDIHCRDVDRQRAGDRRRFDVFVALHAGALRASGIPPVHWRSLHRKITNEVGLPPASSRCYGRTGDFRSSCARERALFTVVKKCHPSHIHNINYRD